ncbi:ANTAR domain-containing response regulator [Roseospira goensis]|uniref:AmiR/NasT family two-component response regulator n=1 Tax=Roseospira goensis TaxID=391922 RepID=A0A7W6WK92_9PROT|nr:ANTAR domain-containing protein [Roseospira goensis]MBB4285197.1 AmiR/NasT family two-component response regulator [Roseospira goensis]
MSGRRVPLPNFHGARAVVLHRRSPQVEPLTRQLARIGLEVTTVWPDLGADQVAAADVVFFDGDMCCDGQFPWPAGDPPVPLIALAASEAPGRLEWMLAQGICAHLPKPVGTGGVFSALVLASHAFAQRRALADEAADLRDRLRRRPQVARALMRLMAEEGLDQDAAYRALRAAAMQQRRSIEDYCAALLVGDGGAWEPAHGSQAEGGR